MAMFAKKDEAQEEIQKAESEAISSIIDKSMSITGEISFQGKTRVDGKITGNISGEHLILSESGTITGDITVTSFNCFGKLEGNVKANLITARKDCSILGRLEANSLTVEPGATIDGEIKAAAKSRKVTQEHKQSPAGKSAQTDTHGLKN